MPLKKVFALAPITKKPGAGLTGKSGTGLTGKSSGGKTGGSVLGGKSSAGYSSGGKSGSSGYSSLVGKSSSGTPSSSKSYFTPTYSSPKNDKSSAGFGIIWLPRRKHNRKKDVIFNSRGPERHREKLDRSPSMYNFMSGDSSENNPYKKKEEETDLLVPDRGKTVLPTVATASSAPDVPPENTASTNPEEKQEFIRRDKEETREAAGDTNEKDIKKDNDYLDNDLKPSENKWDKDKFGDKVDSVYLRPPPAHKSRSATSTQAEEEDCGIKCLYYTLQCCDCVLQ